MRAGFHFGERFSQRPLCWRASAAVEKAAIFVRCLASFERGDIRV
jgi:hypothetical protein